MQAAEDIRSGGLRRVEPLPKALVLAALSLLVFLGFFLAFYGSTIDDAYITARYALRLTEGYPYGAWNPDPREIVEGATTTLWPFVMALSGKKDLLIVTAKIVSALAFAGVVAWMAGALPSRRLGTLLIAADSPFLAIAACGLCAPFAWYAASGMETAFFACLVFLAALLPVTSRDRPWLHFGLCVLLCLTRPDGILIALGACAFYAWIDRSRLKILIALLAAVAVIFIARKLYFGFWLPNTVYAKSGGAGLAHLYWGGRYVLTYALSNLHILALGALALRFRKRLTRLHLALLAGLCAYALLILKSGGDNYTPFALWRHFVQVLPLTLFLAFEFLSLAKAETQRLKAAFAALLLILPFVYSVPPRQSTFLRHALFAPTPASEDPWVGVVDGIARRGTLIASGLGGILPFTVDRARFLDTLGLNDIHIAHLGRFDPLGPVDSKTDMAYVFSRRPDILDAYFRGSLFRARAYDKLQDSDRPQMIRETLCNSSFLDYDFVDTGAYALSDRALFVAHGYYLANRALFSEPVIPNAENPQFLDYVGRYCPKS